jgi:hypothetical protein
MQRRTLLKVGLAGTALLAVGGGVLGLVQPGWKNGAFTPAGRALFAAVARAVLQGSLPAEGSAAEPAALAAHLDRAQAAVAGLPPATQGELAEMMAVLLHPLGRRALTGLTSDWADAPVNDVSTALQGLRHSRLAIRQQVYHALRELTNAAYFAEPSTWQTLGYPGPRPI